MLNLRLGVKIYDNDWYLRHRLTAVEAADLLSDWGVTYVIAQSKLLPMSDNAVSSSVSDEDRAAYESLDDVAFRELIRERGIAYFACLNICFDTSFSASHPELAAIDQHGQPIRQQDWYIGQAPDRQDNLGHKINLLKKAVTELRPDAIHLGFIRWPGFWETWLEGDDRTDKPEYCFSAHTVGMFNRDTGNLVPSDNPVMSAAVLMNELRAQWTDWKCSQTVKAIAQIRQSLEPLQSGLQYSINTLPFFREDFGNAVEEVFGQNIARLSSVVDIFEVMAYHQILARPPEWPAAVAQDILSRSGKRAICTLQAKALYLEGMHAGRRRATVITPEEIKAALGGLASTQLDGVCVFTFTDLLDMRDTADGKAMIAHFRNFRRA